MSEGYRDTVDNDQLDGVDMAMALFVLASDVSDDEGVALDMCRSCISDRRSNSRLPNFISIKKASLLLYRICVGQPSGASLRSRVTRSRCFTPT